jgi:hypothetical protein
MHLIYPKDKRIQLTLKSLLITLTIHPEIDNFGRLKTKPYDKRDDITFPIVNFHYSSITRL